MSEWISVKDRLPTTDDGGAGWSDSVLVRTIGGTTVVDILFWYKLKDQLVPSRWLNVRNVDAVTHWMPLPEPPQENSDE